MNIVDWHLITVHNIRILTPAPHRINMRINKDIIKCCHYFLNSTSKNTYRIEHIIGTKSIQVLNEYFPPRILLLLLLQFRVQVESQSLTHSSSSSQRLCLLHAPPWSQSSLHLLWQLTIHCLPLLQLSPMQPLMEQPVTLPGLKSTNEDTLDTWWKYQCISYLNIAKRNINDRNFRNII